MTTRLPGYRPMPGGWSGMTASRSRSCRPRTWASSGWGGRRASSATGRSGWSRRSRTGPERRSHSAHLGRGRAAPKAGAGFPPKPAHLTGVQAQGSFGWMGSMLKTTMIAALLMATTALSPLGAVADEPLRGVALVIGESDYGALADLANPERDARAMD